MGDIVRFTHSACNFSYDFHAGIGPRLCGEQVHARQNMRSGKWGEHWKSLLEQYPYGTATLHNALCYCKNCEKLYTEPRVTFWIPKKGKVFVFDEQHPDEVQSYLLGDYYKRYEMETMICPDCHNPSEVYENYNRFPCPKCGKLLRGREVGWWD